MHELKISRITKRKNSSDNPRYKDALNHRSCSHPEFLALRVTSALPRNGRFAPLGFYWIPTYCLVSVYRPVRAVDQFIHWLNSSKKRLHYAELIFSVFLKLQASSKLRACDQLGMCKIGFAKTLSYPTLSTQDNTDLEFAWKILAFKKASGLNSRQTSCTYVRIFYSYSLMFFVNPFLLFLQINVFRKSVSSILTD